MQTEIENSCEATIGNPIVPATSEKIQAEVDAIGAGSDPLMFERTYRSRWFKDRAPGARGAGAAVDPQP